MNRLEIFKPELNLIKTDRLRKDAEVLVGILPDYFFEIAASSTGKYHPSYSLGEGGLLRHTKAAVKILNELLETETFGGGFSRVEKDILIIALLMHDGFKLGRERSKYTTFDHPIIAGDVITENKDKLSLTEPELFLMTTAIASHMGQWNTNNYSNVVLPKPIKGYQKILHLADFMASRKYLEVPFEGNNVKES